MIPRLEDFVGKARLIGTDIIWIRMVEDIPDVNDNIRARIESHGDFIFYRRGTKGFDYYKLSPEPNDTEITKFSYSAFSIRATPNLDNYLKRKDIKTLVVTGVYTSRCVFTTASGAVERGYNVFIPPDLVAMPKELESVHKTFLKEFQTIQGFTLNSKSVLQTLRNNQELE